MRSAPASGVRVLHKMLDVVETIKSADDGIGLGALSRTVEMPKATVYRIVATLESRGYLDRRADGAYRLAKKLFDLQSQDSLEQAIQQAALPHMRKLVETWKETVNLGILDSGEVVVINTLESPLAVRMSSKIGNRRHLHATGLGKILLAGLPAKDAARLIQLRGLPRLTANTITRKAALATELRGIREQGYAIDNQENELEGRCVAAPICGPGGDTVAALSVSGPVFRMDVARARVVAVDLKKVCLAISGQLG
jgi:IclR family KDG regulon transcriptional repressor